MSDTYTLVGSDGGDWYGFYKNGKLQSEGHHIRLDYAFKVAGLILDRISVSEQILGEFGDSMPEDLNEIMQLQ